MDHFTYRDGRLHCEDVDVASLAARFGTPLYVYSKATLTRHYTRLVEAFGPLDPLVCFSVKSCPNLHVLKVLASLGSGLDVVSGGELARARLASVAPEKIVYAGVGKSDAEILAALGRPETDEPAPEESEPIGLFNVESEQEFQTIANLAEGVGVKARAALRVNPDVDAHTHKHTTTGTAETKFGVAIGRVGEFFKHYDGHPFLKLSGLHIHLGSPVYTVEPYVEAVKKVLALVGELESRGHRIETLNLGGGFGADYVTGQSLDATEYAKAIVPLLSPWLEERWAKSGRRTKIVLEPGRGIAGSAGILLTRIEYVKTSGLKKFLIVDAGMQTLIRPSLYDAFHFIWPTNVAPQHEPAVRSKSPDLPGLEPFDVVGPICETGDYLARDRALPLVVRGDLLSVFTAGAYGMSMASRYNSHPLPAEVLVDGSQAKLIRRRESYADLVTHEVDVEQG